MTSCGLKSRSDEGGWRGYYSLAGWLSRCHKNITNTCYGMRISKIPCAWSKVTQAKIVAFESISVLDRSASPKPALTRKRDIFSPYNINSQWNSIVKCTRQSSHRLLPRATVLIETRLVVVVAFPRLRGILFWECSTIHCPPELLLVWKLARAH